jgi:hypothetical protein
MDVFARCSKKIAAQVCTEVYNNIICMKEEENWDVVSCLYNICTSMIILLMICIYHSAIDQIFFA